MDTKITDKSMNYLYRRLMSGYSQGIGPEEDYLQQIQGAFTPESSLIDELNRIDRLSMPDFTAEVRTWLNNTYWDDENPRPDAGMTAAVIKEMIFAAILQFDEGLELLNPFSGAGAMVLYWYQVRQWCLENVASCDRDWWLEVAEKAYNENDTEELGRMIIGS